MGNIPDFINLSNYRYNPFNNSYTPKKIGYGANAPEERIISSTAPYMLILHEAPQYQNPSVTRIIDTTLGITLTEVPKTQTPANNQYRVNYDEKGLGWVEFNSSQAGHTIEISYYGLGSINKLALLYSAQSAITNVQIQTITEDTTLSDTQTAGTLQLEFDTRDENVTVILPDASQNEGFQIGGKMLYWGGRAIIQGKGGDTIDGYSEIYLDDKNNKFKLYSNGSEWKIQFINHTIDYFNEFRLTSDWTNYRFGGYVVKYDNKSGNFILGETIEEATSGYQGILMYDDGTYLYLKYSEGNWTNNRQLTGLTSGSTCDVDEVTGSTQNVNSEIYDGITNVTYDKKKVLFWWSQLITYENFNRLEPYIFIDEYTGLMFGFGIGWLNSSKMRLTSANNGIEIIGVDGSEVKLTTQAYYFKLKLQILY